MTFPKDQKNKVSAYLLFLSGFQLIFKSTLLWATPPPKECIGTPPSDFTSSFPAFPLGESAWILCIIALIIPIYSHIQCKDLLIKSQDLDSSSNPLNYEGNQRRQRWCFGFTLTGMLISVGSSLFFLLLLFTGFFRNDCHFCQLNRPQPRAIILEEIKLVGIMLIITTVYLLLIRRVSRSPLFQHGLTLLVIPLGLITWIILLNLGNQAYLGAYCTP